MTADTESRTPPPAAGGAVPLPAEPGVDILFTQATFPTPSLLPPEVRQRRQIAASKRRLGIALVLLAVTLGLWWGIARLQLATATAELNNAQAELRAAEQEQEKYRDVPVVFAAVAAARSELAQAMGSEVQVARLLSDLSIITPPGVSLLDMSLVTTVAQQDSASATTVAATADEVGVGSVTFTGSAATFEDVSTWIDTLRGNSDYRDVVLTEVSRDSTSGVYSFTSSAELSDQALSARFVEEER